MSIYIEQIEQLVVLQKVDSEMITLERILEEAPKQLQSLLEKRQYLEQQQAVIQEKMDVLMEQKGRIEGEIENDAQKVKKSKNKLMMVENTKEYHAMMREMDNLEKLNRSREEEKAALQEELTRQNGVVAGIEAAGDLLATHFPRDHGSVDEDELPNRPVLL